MYVSAPMLRNVAQQVANSHGHPDLRRIQRLQAR